MGVRHWAAAGVLCASVALTALASAQAQTASYPTRPVTILTPFAAGSVTDAAARLVAQTLQDTLGQPFVVENRAGAGGLLAAGAVARAKNDGYTLLLNHIGMSTIPTLVRNVPFKVESDFEYLGIVNDVPMTLIGKPQLEAANYKDLTTWIAANKGKINLGNAGVGSASHLCGLLYQNALKVEMTTVPYKGTAPAITDLIGGNIDLLCDQTTNTSPQIEGKKVKPYAVTTSKRLTTPLLKDLPTLQESGLKDFQVTIWHGLYAPKGTPPAITKKLNDALKSALKDPDFIKKEEALGAVVASDGRVEPDGHKKFVVAEIAKWSPIIKAAGVYAD
jgi:tripartite-type tricarboxylate transporter receptor subunit TctC